MSIDNPQPFGATDLAAKASSASTISEASRMLQYQSENLIYFLVDGAWRSYSTDSTAIMQRVQDAFGNTSRFKVYIWYNETTVQNVQITSV